MFKKIDLLYLGAGILAISTGAQLIADHIDRTETSKSVRVLEKVGLGCGCFAAAGLLADIIVSGNLARDFNAGNILLKAVDTTKEIVA